MSLKNDTYKDSREGQSECAHILYKDSSCVGSEIGNYRQLKCEYLQYVYVCKGKQLSRQAEYRREQRSCFTTDPDCQQEEGMSNAGRDRQVKAGKVEKAEKRYRSRRSAQPANGRDENLPA